MKSILVGVAIVAAAMLQLVAPAVALAEDIVRVAGYMAPNAILIFADSPQRAYFVSPGDVINGVRIKTINGAAVLAEAGGKPFSMQPSATPFPADCATMQDYLMNVVRRVEKLRPSVQERVLVTIGANGGVVNDPSSLSYFLGAQPFGPLPPGVQSITIDAAYGYPTPLQAHITEIRLSKPAF